jgi:hypothetical protein
MPPITQPQFGGYAIHSLRIGKDFLGVYTEATHKIIGDKPRSQPRMDGLLVFKHADGELHAILFELKKATGKNVLNDAVKQATDNVAGRYVERSMALLKTKGCAIKQENFHIVALNMTNDDDGSIVVDMANPSYEVCCSSYHSALSSFSLVFSLETPVCHGLPPLRTAAGTPVFTWQHHTLRTQPQHWNALESKVDVAENSK